jgi:hypothetical protein
VRVFRVEFKPHKIGWLCQVFFRYPSTPGEADGTAQSFASSRFWPLAYLRAMRNARRLYGRLTTQPVVPECVP